MGASTPLRLPAGTEQTGPLLPLEYTPLTYTSRLKLTTGFSRAAHALWVGLGVGVPVVLLVAVGVPVALLVGLDVPLTVDVTEGVGVLHGKEQRQTRKYLRIKPA